MIDAMKRWALSVDDHLDPLGQTWLYFGTHRVALLGFEGEITMCKPLPKKDPHLLGIPLTEGDDL